MPARTHQPSPILAERLRACRLKIQQKKADGYLITDRLDQFYLTGFDGEDGAALILPQRVYLLTDGRFKEAAETSAGWAHLVIRNAPPYETIARLARKHRISRLGFQPEALSVADHATIRRAIRPAKLVAIPKIINELRLRKDPTEIAAIQKAVRVAESAFRAVLRRIRLGMTERELAAQLQHEILRQGATGASFPVIIAEGVNASRPHAQPGNRKIRASSAVLIDWGANVDNYCSDLTRVVFVRRIPPQFRRMYNNVLAAQTEAIKAIRPVHENVRCRCKSPETTGTGGYG